MQWKIENISDMFLQYSVLCGFSYWSVINSKCWNCSTNILCCVLNSRLLKSTILKFSFIFIKFWYNMSIRVVAAEPWKRWGQDDKLYIICGADKLFYVNITRVDVKTTMSISIWIIFFFPVLLFCMTHNF